LKPSLIAWQYPVWIVGLCLFDILKISDSAWNKPKARVEVRGEEGGDLPHRSLECGSGMAVRTPYNALWLVMIIEDRVGVVSRNHG